MKTIRFYFTTFALLVLAGGLAQAQATRTWVSGVGDDANPCSRTAPCKTFAGAISKTAPAGEIDVLDPGGFGALTITKSITIDGGAGQVAGVLVSGTNGLVVAAGANDTVVLRNLDINGIGTGLSGIKFVSGKALHIEHCVIYGFTMHGIDLESTAGGGKVSVVDTISRDNTGSGLFNNGGGLTSVMVSNSHFQNNANGVIVQGSFGVVINSEASGNSATGFSALNGAELDLVNSLAMKNATGVTAVGGTFNSLVRMSGVSISTNTNGFIVGTGGVIDTFKNNSITDTNTGTATAIALQ